MLTGLLGQSSTCAAACAQTKNVPRSTRATRALPALPCAGVPTAERRKTALSRPITIALSDTSVPFAVVALRTSDACVQPNAESNPLPSFQHRRRHDLPTEKRDGRSAPSRATIEDAHLFEHPELMIHAQCADQRPDRSRRVSRATAERKTWGRAQTPGTQRCPKQPNSDTGGEVMSSPFRSRCMDTGRGTRWAPETTKPICRCRELLPRAGVCHEEW